ncbi:MAG TPA: serine/threonine-protein kinase, partial [Polyangiaceae bacterium]|nr:serine/threonine-protein kinase [Polyangiaceae bacterium]
MSDTDRPNVDGVRVGDILAGKYRIERVLGSGGMGVVVAARHLQLDEMVAIKYLSPGALEHPTAVSRFLREAKAAVRIKSEHVARVSDVGTLSTGVPYLVMEYLEGGDLAQWLKKHGRMSIEQAVEFVLQALEAIADAHGLGIVHRDLKPANLFCVRRSDGLFSIKLLDFGISKAQDPRSSDDHGDITAPAVVMGSPLYMSPEQMRSAREVDARTDIWSIGVILYELLTGVAPFAGTTVSEICVKAASEAPVPMRTLRPDLPLELEAV